MVIGAWVPGVLSSINLSIKHQSIQKSQDTVNQIDTQCVCCLYYLFKAVKFRFNISQAKLARSLKQILELNVLDIFELCRPSLYKKKKKKKSWPVSWLEFLLNKSHSTLSWV